MTHDPFGPPSVTRRAGLVALLSALALAGCGDASDDGAERPGVGGALGADATVTTLARARLPQRPASRVAWVADEVRLAPRRRLEHRHEPAFVYVRDGAAVLERRGDRARLEERRGGFVPGGTTHRHGAAARAAAIWEIRLAPRGAQPPAGGRRVFESEPLAGIPSRPIASFLEVTMPARGGMTTVHTHPGPEFIYQLEGRIEYQNALIGAKELGPGGAEAIPPDTPVQKRNPFPQSATFLSWFLVDPDKPFAPSTSFDAD